MQPFTYIRADSANATMRLFGGAEGPPTSAERNSSRAARPFST